MGAHVAGDGLERRPIGLEVHAQQSVGHRPGAALAPDRHLRGVADQARREGQRLVEPALAGRPKERLLDLLGLGDGECRRSGDRLVDRQRHAGGLGDEPGKVGEPLQVQAAVDAEVNAKRYREFLERHLAGELAEAVDRRVDHGGAAAYRGHRVGDRHRGVVVAMHLQRLVGPAAHRRNEVLEPPGRGDADRIADHEFVPIGLGLGDEAAQVIGPCTRRIHRHQCHMKAHRLRLPGERPRRFDHTIAGLSVTEKALVDRDQNDHAPKAEVRGDADFKGRFHEGVEPRHEVAARDFAHVVDLVGRRRRRVAEHRDAVHADLGQRLGDADLVVAREADARHFLAVALKRHVVDLDPAAGKIGVDDAVVGAAVIGESGHAYS